MTTTTQAAVGTEDAAWDDAEKAAKEMGGKFLDLKTDGRSAIGSIIGTPNVKTTYFDEKTNKSEPWSAEHEKAGHRKSTQFQFNFVVYSEGVIGNMKKLDEPKVKIATVNGGGVLEIVELRKKFAPVGGIEKAILQITRHGEKAQTKYAVTPDVPVYMLTDAQYAHHKTLTLHDLKGLTETEDASTDMNSLDKGKAAAAATAPLAPPAPPAVITVEQATAILARIRTLPDAKGKEFVALFLNGKRLTDLLVSQLDQATAWVLAAETEQKAAIAAQQAAAAAAMTPPANSAPKPADPFAI